MFGPILLTYRTKDLMDGERKLVGEETIALLAIMDTVVVQNKEIENEKRT